MKNLETKIEAKLREEIEFDTIRFDGSDIYVDGKLEYQHNDGDTIKQAWAENSETPCKPEEINIEEYSSFSGRDFYCEEIDVDYWVYKL